MLKSVSIPVTESSQVGEARRASQKIALAIGLNETTTGNLGIVATEVATNLHKHARHGEVILRGIRYGERIGVELLSVDRGPGIVEVNRCLEDGYSTSGTKGNGLGSIKRLASVFDIYSTPQGTVMLAQLWQGNAPTGDSPLDSGGVCLPYPGEHLCGDAWASAIIPNGHCVIVADGLGHGSYAAEASDLAISLFEENPNLPPSTLLQKVHAGLRSTRGAAVSVLQFDARNRKLIYSGIGNVSSLCVQGAVSKSFVSLNGTIGHSAQRFQEFTYDWMPSSLVIIHSDGLQTKWRLDSYPGLQMRHPSLVAGVLFRDFRRDRDDATIIVLR